MFVMNTAVVGFINNTAVHIVVMVVVVGIDSDISIGVVTEQFEISWVIGDTFWVAVATHMLIQANDMICGCHYDM